MYDETEKKMWWTDLCRMLNQEKSDWDDAKLSQENAKLSARQQCGARMKAPTEEINSKSTMPIRFPIDG